MELPIPIDKERISEFCQQWHLRKLAFFGSILTERFNADSDVDVLFEYDPDHIPTLFDVVTMER